MVVRMTVGLVLTVIALAIAGRRLWWLWRLAMSGQPAPERVAAVREHPGRDVETQAAEVIGQRKLLKWSVPGVAHALTLGKRRDGNQHPSQADSLMTRSNQ
jgi:hypothetical protein